jgi:hypothetical protein
MARDVEADVTINDKSDRGLGSFVRNLRNADKELKDTQRDIDKVSGSTNKLGSAADRNAQSISRLNRQIQSSQRELQSLARAYADTDDAAKRIDLGKAFNKQQTEIRKLTKTKGILEAITPDPADVVGLGTKLATGITSGLGSLGPATPIIAGAAIAAAPLIASTIAGAVIGGAGIGGVVGGVLVASKDARVQGAFQGFSEDLGKRLETAAVPFIDTTIAGIGEIDKAIDSVDLESIFRNSAEFVAPLSEGVGSFITDLGDGIEDLVANAGPVIDSIGRGLEDIGESLGEGLSSLSDNADEAAASLDTVLSSVANLTTGTFAAINGVIELKSSFDEFAGGILAFDSGLKLINKGFDLLSDNEGKRRGGSGTFGPDTEGVNQFARATEEAQEPLRSLNELMNQAANNALGLYGAETQVGEAIQRVTQVAQENGNSLSTNTAQGIENRNALQGLVGALNGQYNAYVAVNGEGGRANEIASSNSARFVELAGKFGLSSSKAQELAGKMGLIPSKTNTNADFNTGNALAAANRYKGDLAGIPRSITTVVNLVRRITNTSVSDSAIESGLRKQNANFASTDFSQSEGVLGRTGGATPAVDVNNTISVLLDGSVIDTKIVSATNSQARRDSWNSNRTRR